MPHKILICGKWEMEVIDGKGGYYQYANGRQNEVRKNSLCIEWLLQELPSGLKVVEHFGGVGAFATVVQKTLNPSIHRIYDTDQDCFNQLRHLFRYSATVKVMKGNAKELMGRIEADLVLMDFPFHTAKQYEVWENQWNLLLSLKPNYLLWMDGAARYLHFHRKLYGNILNCSIQTHEDYAKGLSEFYRNKYNYTITKATYYQGCFYFLARPLNRFKIIKNFFNTKLFNAPSQTKINIRRF